MSPSVVSVPDPFAPLDCGQPPTFRAHNSPREPVVAVNPRNPLNIVVSYIVDSNLTNLVRTSFDGGITWKTVIVPGLSECTGGTQAIAADPSLAFSSDGSVLYLASVVTPVPAPPTDGVAVTTSRDGGLSWSPPTTLASGDGLWGDKNYITTDPDRPQTAYLTYERRDWAMNSASTLYFQRTDDGGKTWSARSAIYRQPDTGLSTGNAKVWRTAAGTLTVVFDRIISCQVNRCRTGYDDNVVYASVSVDEGQHWAAPVQLGLRTAGNGTNDPLPSCGVQDDPVSAIAPDGTLFVAFPVDARSPAFPLAMRVVLRSSKDGVAWNEQTLLTTASAIGLPALAVTHDGTVAMTYYQNETSRCAEADGTTPSDLWLTHGDGQGGWVTSKVAGPFDASGNCFFPAAAALVSICGIADYHGLSAAGRHGLVAVFERPRARAEMASDIMFAQLLGDHWRGTDGNGDGHGGADNPAKVLR